MKLLPYATPHYFNKEGRVILPTDYGDKEMNIFGTHNLQNLEAARRVCNYLGISDKKFYESAQSFKGAARRLEKVYDSDNLIVFRDFAHAPSKLKATLEAVREQFPQHKLIACFELHTFSSLNTNFLNQYAGSMDACDNGAVFFSSHSLMIKKLPPLPPALVKNSFRNNQLHVFEKPEDLRSWIEAGIKESKQPVCLLLMSSGTFTGMDLNFQP